MSDTLMPTYKRLPVTFVRGEGAWLWDSNGKRYLDAVAGVAVCGLGHAHPAITQALCAQLSTLIHTSNLYEIELQTQLGTMLTQLSNMERVFFANSGAEANEAAIKLARLYGHAQGIETPQIVVMESSFHGRTLATLTATGNYKVQTGFAPLVPGFIRVPYGNIAELQRIANANQDVVAVLIEPIQGEGGIVIPPHNYLNLVRELCDRQNWLLILDEIQTGLGRTGEMFACQHNAVIPDVMTLAKSLGNGIPIGACLAQGKAASLFTPGSHGSTFGGNLLACRAAITVLNLIQQQNLVTHSAILGTRLLDALHHRLTEITGVNEVRGKGLMLGIELAKPCGELVTWALEAGLLINVTAERVIRLLPPLILEDSQADQIIDTLTTLIKRFL